MLYPAHDDNYRTDQGIYRFLRQINLYIEHVIGADADLSQSDDQDLDNHFPVYGAR